MIRVLSVFGTRPEAIKLAPVVRAIQRREGQMHSLVCATGQHRHMLDQVLELFDLRPDVDLDLMEHDQSLAWLTARAITGLTDVLEKLRPDVVLVQGDTTSAMSAALAAFYKRIPIGHVEAGLRTSSLDRPFPEEMNRRVLGRLATYHFAPTPRAARALLREGVAEEAIFVTGNPVVDALRWIDTHRPASEAETLLARLCPAGTRTLLVTVHRREIFGRELRQICEGLAGVVRRNPDVRIVYPVHPNPNVTGVVRELLAREQRITLLDPVPYDVFVQLMKRAYVLVTDSGGLQEEGPVFGKPVLVLRNETERPEGIEVGVARLVGTESAAIIDAVECLLRDEATYRAMATAASPYGDGRSGERIAEILARKL